MQLRHNPPPPGDEQVGNKIGADQIISPRWMNRQPGRIAVDDFYCVFNAVHPRIRECDAHGFGIKIKGAHRLITEFRRCNREDSRTGADIQE